MLHKPRLEVIRGKRPYSVDFEDTATVDRAVRCKDSSVLIDRTAIIVGQWCNTRLLFFFCHLLQPLTGTALCHSPLL